MATKKSQPGNPGSTLTPPTNAEFLFLYLVRLLSTSDVSLKGIYVIVNTLITEDQIDNFSLSLKLTGGLVTIHDIDMYVHDEPSGVESKIQVSSSVIKDFLNAKLLARQHSKIQEAIKDGKDYFDFELGKGSSIDPLLNLYEVKGPGLVKCIRRLVLKVTDPTESIAEPKD